MKLNHIEKLLTLTEQNSLILRCREAEDKNEGWKHISHVLMQVIAHHEVSNDIEVDWDAWKQSEIGTSVLTGVEGFLDTYHHFLKQANERHEEKHALENEYYERCREDEMQEQWENDQNLSKISNEEEDDNEESDNDRWDREQEQRERWELKDQDESDKLMMEKEQAEEKHKAWLDQALTTLRKNAPKDISKISDDEHRELDEIQAARRFNDNETPEDSHYQEENLDRVRGQAYDPYAEEPEDRDYPEEQTGE